MKAVLYQRLSQDPRLVETKGAEVDLKMLEKGDNFLKYFRKGGSATRKLWMSADGSELKMGAPMMKKDTPKPKFWDYRRYKTIRTKTLRRYSWAPRAPRHSGARRSATISIAAASRS